MLKSLAVGLLALSAAGATVAFAHDNNGNDNHGMWPQHFNRWCEHHKRCDKWEDRQEQGNTDPPPAAAPEIDPADALGALTLLAGGLAVIRGRRRSGAA